MPDRIFFLATLMVLFFSQAEAKHLHSEKFYQEKWCRERSGEIEVVLPDRTRCDCLTTYNAIEFDFGVNWAEAIGQSLYYSIQTGRKAGIALILEKSSDYKYWLRLNTVIKKNNLKIDTWIVRP